MARPRAFIRGVLGGITAVMLALGATTAAVAAEPTGSITGVVTSAAGGATLPGIDVHAVSDDGLGVADAVTDENGVYTLEGLIDGDWVVRFSAPGGSFAAEYWNDAVEQWAAERIQVTDGAPITGIDAALAPAPTGSISGVVTRESDGTPVAGVEVSAGGEGAAWLVAYTDDSGAYTLTGVAPGSHIVSFFAAGTDLKREYWDGATRWDEATPVVVGDGTAVADIDASLSAGGAITGVVTRAADGSPVENASVTALDANREIVAAVHTDSAGAYRLDGLPSGSYVVRFGTDDPSLAAEYWENVYAWPAATPITVSPLQTVVDVDAALESVGYISGTVTKAADGSPVFGTVSVSDVNQELDMQIVDLDDEGGYRVPVVPGRYLVQFHAYESGLLDEYWENVRTRESATTVEVAAGEDVDAVNAQLESAAVITGTVTLDSDEDREVLVEAWSGTEIVGVAYVDLHTGAYSLSLPAGTYILKASATFYDGSKTTAEPQFYDGVATAAEATPVSAVIGAPVAGIDFTLVPVTGQPQPKPTLALSVGTIQAGKVLTVSGTGFAPRERVSFELRSDPIALGTLTADAGGALKGSLRIPASAPAGAHTLVALNEQSVVVASAALRVTAATGAGGSLATTGADAPVAAVTAAFAAVVLGLLLVRRRRVES